MKSDVSKKEYLKLVKKMEASEITDSKSFAKILSYSNKRPWREFLSIINQSIIDGELTPVKPKLEERAKLLEGAQLLVNDLNETLAFIFDKIEKQINIKEIELVQSYLSALIIDLLGKLLNFPGLDKQEKVDYLCKWIKHKHNLTLKIDIA